MQKSLLTLAVVLLMVLGFSACGRNDEPNTEPHAIILPELANYFDTIHFGGFDWLVLDRQENKALIVTEMIIEQRPFSVELQANWATSDIRQYLNNEFYYRFDDIDRARIATVVNQNNNPWFETYTDETEDRIFLLGLDEVVKYFGDSGILRNRHDDTFFIDDDYNVMRTALAFPYGGWVDMRRPWWTRTLGSSSRQAVFIDRSGEIFLSGASFEPYVGGEPTEIGVRPALWLLFEPTEHDYTEYEYAILPPTENVNIGIPQTPSPQIPSNASILFSNAEFIITQTELYRHRTTVDSMGRPIASDAILRANDYFSDGLILVRRSGKYGFSDKNWNNVIPTIYEEAFSFSEGLAAVRTFNEWTGRYAWGFINTSGDMIIPAQFDAVRSFNDERAAVRIGNEWGYIDTSGEIVIQPDQHMGTWRAHQGFVPHDFRDGLALTSVVRDGVRHQGYMNRNGDVIINLSAFSQRGFFHGRDFNEGLALIGDEVGRRAAFIDTSGNIVFELRDMPATSVGRDISSFNEGFAIVTHTFTRDLDHVRDREGNIVFTLEGRDIRFASNRFSEGLIPVQSTVSNRFGFLNTEGEVVIPFIFDTRPNDFHSGLSALRGSANTQYIDREGNILFTLSNTMGLEFIDDVAVASAFSGGTSIVSVLEIIRR